MTTDEIDRLASLIADELRRTLESAPPAPQRDPWLAPPVRPEPPARSGALPAWSGAAQSLGDVAPVRHPSPSAHRADPGEAAAAVRSAAAGRGDRPPHRTARSATGATGSERAEPRSPASRRHRAGVIEVPVGVSRRHLHLSEAHALALFGTAALDVHRPIRQPGQFAATQMVTAIGAEGRLEGVRVVGPARGETQLELACRDAVALGIAPTVAASGSLEGSSGGVTLVGPHGRVALDRGVILAARHLHLSPADGARWGMRDGDRLDITCGEGARAVTWHGVLVRCGPAHATEFHLDEDEASAAGVATGATARVVGWHAPTSARRPLVTERDLLDRVRRGLPIPADAIVTPGARDRARSLGLELP